MLTRLRVKGFKNLVDFDIRFGAFTCLVGPNGVGKSNIFDAIHFLHLLTQHPIMDAMDRIRESGDRSMKAETLFSTIDDGHLNEMSFIADMIVEPEARDALGSATASKTALRYELGFRLEKGKPSRLALVHEALVPIGNRNAREELSPWAGRPFLDSCITGGQRAAPFISTDAGGGQATIAVHQDQRHGRKLTIPVEGIYGTVLGHRSSSEYPTILAAHAEMRAWKQLFLEPSAMRAPSRYQDPSHIDAHGGNMPCTIRRLVEHEAREGMTCATLTNSLSGLIHDVREIRVTDNPVMESYTLEVRGRRGPFFSARSLSDGTLRFLALATILQDPEARGVICLEEPENGIHPGRVEEMVQLLRDIAVEPNMAVDKDNPLRQVIVNTHSPKVVEALNAKRDLVLIQEGPLRLGDEFARSAMPYVHPDNWRLKLDSAPNLCTIPAGDLYDYIPSAVQWELFPATELARG